MAAARLLVTSDPDLDMTPAMASQVQDMVDAWLGGDRPAIVFGPGLHVATQLPDGAWVRICHDHPAGEPVPEAEHEPSVPPPSPRPPRSRLLIDPPAPAG